MAETCSVWILGDQLLASHPALEAAEEAYGRAHVRVLLVESAARLRRRPYHRQKLVLLLSAMRHYADRLRDLGWSVDYVRAETALSGLRQHIRREQPGKLIAMQASEFGGRRFQSGLSKILDGLPVEILDNTQFLTGRFNPIPDPEPEKQYVMEYFYRDMRRHFGLLMDGSAPAGGSWNYDRENRKPLPEGLTAPALPVFEPDSITNEVIREVKAFEQAIGPAEPFRLAVTHDQAEEAFLDFLSNRLADFGPYEDAMSSEQAVLFHSLLSPYLNTGLLDPLDLARRVEAAFRSGDAPIHSVEGFIRQVTGWREYIYWQYHRTMPALEDQNYWQAHHPLPEMFWTGETDMACLRTAFERVHRTGYLHHIERLMLLTNFSLLAGLEPGVVNDWFLSSFVDAYEWVMAPNVIGMGLHADGGLTATKPYIASANYINRMSDYCSSCRYDPKVRHGPDACPFNALYWNFLIVNEDTLRSAPRMGPNVLGLRYLDKSEREKVQAHAQKWLDDLD